jgi:hypothetical protein
VAVVEFSTLACPTTRSEGKAISAIFCNSYFPIGSTFLFNKRKRNAKIIPKQSSVMCIFVNQKSLTIPDRLTTKPVLALAPAEESSFITQKSLI